MLEIRFITELVKSNVMELEIIGKYRNKKVKIFLCLPAYLIRL